LDQYTLVHELQKAHDDNDLFVQPVDKPVQVLTEDGDVYDIVTVEYDPAAEVTYLKCESAE
jgi:hypothetical protein